MKISFTLRGAPRTKKNHGRVVHVRFQDPLSGKMKRIPKHIQSQAHDEWFYSSTEQIRLIRRYLVNQGIAMPIPGPVAVRALFYRETDVGDTNGYEQALGDLLQWQKRDKWTKEILHYGLIKDDRQIEHWDGSRRLVDRERPRVEVEITVIGAPEIAIDVPQILFGTVKK